MYKKNSLISKCYEKNHLSFLLTIIVLSIGALLLASMAIAMQEIVDFAVSGTIENLSDLLVKLFIYISLLACGWLLELIFRNRFLEKALKQLKEEIFIHISSKGISSFSKEPTGRYLSVLTNDINSIEANYLQNNFGIILNCFYFIAALSIMLWYDILLTFCALGLVIFSLILSVIFSGKLAKEEKKVSAQNESFVSLIKDILNGFSVIKSFQAEKEINTLFSTKNRSLEHCKCRRKRTEASINLLSSCLGIFVQASVMLLCACFSIEGRISVGVVIAFVQLMNYIIMPIQQLPPALANRTAALALFTKIEEVTAINQEISSEEELISIGRGITLENVSFGYDSEENILHNLNFTFEKGKSYAILGASGSGKSTLLNLLLGGYKTYAGNITIGEKELKNISLDSLYDYVSVVQQNVFVFDNTIENNITMFKSFPKEEIDSAIKKSGLSDFIKEKGLSYQCGENGCNLSGGEKQRISIARALLCKSSILLMDEATSALDTTTASAIEDNLLKMKDILRIVITHKVNPEILKQYDQVLLLENGHIKKFSPA